MTRARRLLTVSAPRTPRQRGFTLLELLLAITILGLLMSVLAGGLRFGARAWESGDARAEELTELGVVQGFLRRLIGQAHPTPLIGPSAPAQPALLGAADGMVFIALAPAELAGGGFYLFSLSLEEADDARELVLDWRPLDGGAETIDVDAPAHRTLLIEGIEAASFAYFDPGGPTRTPGWRDTWQDPQFLPSLVRLQIAFADRNPPWPELLVRPMIDPSPTPP
jgi:general secretion pathway protein J